MLSEYQRDLAKEYDINIQANSNTPKLICSLYDKVRYLFSSSSVHHLTII